MAEGPTGQGFSDVDGTGRAGGYAGYLEMLAARLARRRTARFPWLALAPGGSVLDVGCGVGLLLDEARRRGWRTQGVELSDWGVRRARHLGLDIFQGTLEEAGFAKP